MRTWAAILLLALNAGQANAQPATPSCASFSSAYERSADRAARLRAEGTIRTQVIESSANSALLANELSVLQLNVELMKGAGCPLPKAPFDIDAYVPAAAACVQAVMSKTRGPVDLCDRANWKPAPPR